MSSEPNFLDSAPGDHPTMGSWAFPPTPGHRQIQTLIESSLLMAEDWEALPVEVAKEITQQTDLRRQLQLLVKHNLLTEYQVVRFTAGKTFGLILEWH